MLRAARHRLTYANVMSSLAVFLVLGGGAAFAALGKNTVGTPQLKKNAVKTNKIGRNAVKVGKLAPEAAKAGKIAKNAIASDRLREKVVTTEKLADNAVTGDKTDGSIQKSDDLLFATVAPANAGAAILRGRGAVSVSRVVAGSFIVTFNRDITGCTWLATYGQPNNAFVDARWATVRGRTEANQVGVVLRDKDGNQVDGNGFHVAALCP